VGAARAMPDHYVKERFAVTIEPQIGDLKNERSDIRLYRAFV
jgi:hypothetical protein